MAVRAHKFHNELLTTISVAKEFLGLSYHDIMCMPLKDFYGLLRIKSREEKQKQEYLQRQQANNMNQLRTKETKIRF
nr:MAG TPA: hypothetical protein [Caudoviricetes sp.]